LLLRRRTFGETIVGGLVVKVVSQMGFDDSLDHWIRTVMKKEKICVSRFIDCWHQSYQNYWLSIAYAHCQWNSRTISIFFGTMAN